ncbi:hypothetical protein [Pseudomonas sp. CFBP 5748]|nr:hypothetical protein [uncultured Pseudomonas sp.]
MSISAITVVNPYPFLAPNISIKGREDGASISPAISTETDEDSVKGDALRVDISDANVAGANSGGDLIEHLKKQIEQAEKLLANQQAQLARVQKSQTSEEQKTQQDMAIQTQIMGTQGALQTLRGALMQAMTVSIDTHA